MDVNVLLNGCSFVYPWDIQKDYPASYNLSKPGSSLYRVIRTTMEFCAVNNVKTVFVGLPFVDRIELPLGENDSEIEGPYIQSTSSQLHNHTAKFYTELGKYSDYYAIDRYFTELIGFCGWMDQQNIDYIIWDSGNDFQKEYLEPNISLRKIKYILDNPKIINLFEFCANIYLAENHAKYLPEEKSILPKHRHYGHYDSNQFDILRDYINDYRSRPA